jgi:hypothetical protein
MKWCRGVSSLVVLVALVVWGCGGGGALTTATSLATTTAPPPATSVLNVPATTATTVPDYMARVGDVYITRESFDQHVAVFAVQYAGEVPDKVGDPAGYHDFEHKVLDYLVTCEVARQKAPFLGAAFSTSEVRQVIDNVIEEHYGGDRSDFLADLADQNTTLDQLESFFGEQILVQRVYDTVCKEVGITATTGAPGAGATDKSKVWNDWLASAKAELGVLYKPGWGTDIPAKAGTSSPTGGAATTTR